MKHEFLFVHIPKTAGNAIQNVLQSYSEDHIVSLAAHQDGVERFEVRSDVFDIKKHSTLRQYRAQLGPKKFQRLFKFACVRNPWERAISFYFSPHWGGSRWDRGAFIELLQRMHPVDHYLCLSQDAAQTANECYPSLDFIIRYENLDKDFADACGRIGIPFAPLAVRNRSEKRPYHEYYDDELIAIVGERYSREIACFGYEFASG